ncbi:MAG: hypothetical protein Q8O42_20150 [Acidobacteriota bacterium]|nr:hypothetical protein [Acidobacteriota bacterium]
METALLGMTVISLVVALVMSVTAWRLVRDEKRRSSARVASLSIAAAAPGDASNSGGQGLPPDAIGFQAQPVIVEKPRPRAPWAPAPVAAEVTSRSAFVTPPPVPELPLHTAPSRNLSHASGFLGADSEPAPQASGRQRSLAVAAAVLLVVLVGSLAWTMSAPRGTSAAAVGPNSPLELVSLRHDRKNEKIAVSGLVRNPAAGKPVERLAAVVFLFDRQGTFVTSAKADVDFLKLGGGDESPFVVSLDAPATVARYRVSFRTDEGVVPHIDRRGAAPIATEGEQPVSVTLK